MIVYDRQSTDTMHDHRFVCSVCGQRSGTFRDGGSSRSFELVEFIRQADRMGWLFVIPDVRSTDPVQQATRYFGPYGLEEHDKYERLYEGRSFCPRCKDTLAADKIATEVYMQRFPTCWERLLEPEAPVGLARASFRGPGADIRCISNEDLELNDSAIG